jgi:hypothetical protein
MQRRASARRLDADPWIELFEEGCRRRADGRTEVVPYWVFSQGDDAKIEHHLPFLPMSKEDVRLTQLRTSLAIYRLAFGQPARRISSRISPACLPTKGHGWTGCRSTFARRRADADSRRELASSHR